jgi:hypothetical protein
MAFVTVAAVAVTVTAVAFGVLSAANNLMDPLPVHNV